MPGTRKDLVADKGYVFPLVFTFPAGYNLTGQTATLVLYTAGSNIAFFSATGTISGQTITFKATDEQTATWPVGKAVYNFHLEELSGDKHLKAFGALTVRNPVIV